MPAARLMAFAVLSLAAIQASHASDVVLLGDESRTRLLESCRTCAVERLTIATPRRGATAHEVADASRDARHAVIVVDATSGPLPIVREHILVARQAGVPSLSVMFTNVAKLEGAFELLQLEELEVRELMNNYEMGGDDAMVFHDSPIDSAGTSSSSSGMEDLLREVKRLPPRAPLELEPFTGKRFAVRLYLLSPEESADTVPLSNGTTVGLWIDGQSRQARVQSAAALDPGTDGELEFEVDEAISSGLGARLLLERNGRPIAAGVLIRG